MPIESGKQIRQKAIRGILNRGTESSQEDIRDYLHGKGIEASQATLSRDLREMGAVKIPVNGGGSVYRLQQTGSDEQHGLSNYEIDFEPVGNLLLIKTTLGSAPGLCVLIDKLNLPQIAGTVAGDDTIIAVLRSNTDVPGVIGRIKNVR